MSAVIKFPNGINGDGQDQGGDHKSLTGMMQESFTKEALKRYGPKAVKAAADIVRYGSPDRQKESLMDRSALERAVEAVPAEARRRLRDAGDRHVSNAVALIDTWAEVMKFTAVIEAAEKNKTDPEFAVEADAMFRAKAVQQAGAVLKR